MKIRPEHIDPFQKRADLMFFERIKIHLTTKYPELLSGIPVWDLEEMIEHGVARARRHNLHAEHSIVQFLEFMVAFAPNFDEHPKIAARLNAAGVTESQRIESIYALTSFEEWKAVAGAYDPQAWGVNLQYAPELARFRGSVSEIAP